jgi:flavin reductase (DIM6/NTAB) family NADH-FMN oxidoreductase RutF
MRFEVANTPPRTIYNLINGLVVPRPIAWVTTLNPDGSVNAAPFSSYNYLCMNPPILGFGVAAVNDGLREVKDTARNIERTGEFVVNVVTEDLGEKMNITGVDFPPGVSELEMAGLTAEPSQVVKPPRVKEAHAALECRLWQVLKPLADHHPQGDGHGLQMPTEKQLVGDGPRIVLGKVVAIYVEDRFIDPAGPYVLAKDLHAIGRMNGLSYYVHTRDAFMEIKRMNYQEWRSDSSPQGKNQG